MLISHVGYSKKSFESLGSGRDCPSIPDSVRHNNEFSVNNQKINQFFSQAFTKKIETKEDERFYNLTALIAKQFLILRPECGLAYPTVAMRANADNFVLTVDAADNYLKISEAHWFQINDIQIDALGEAHYTIQPTLYANEFPDGKINWKTTTNEQKIDLIHSLGADSWS
jgi:hypothetical protein